MIGTCERCGSFLRGGPCPHCAAPARSGTGARVVSAAVLLLGLSGLSGCPIEADYGVVVTDSDTDDQTTDTGDTGE